MVHGVGLQRLQMSLQEKVYKKPEFTYNKVPKIIDESWLHVSKISGHSNT